MKLIWFEVNGYKRFAELTKMNLDGKLVAIVGPNEAGKTSLLRAMEHFNHRNHFVASGGSQELTRGKPIADDETITEWTFAIDDDDHEALKVIPEAAGVRWFATYKKKSGETFDHLSPCPKRSLELRKALLDEVKSLPDQETNSDDEDQDALVDDVISLLELNEEDLPSERVGRIVELAEQLEDESARASSTLSDKLRRLHVEESLESPSTRAGQVLLERKPSILLFSDDDRDLRSEYDLNSFFLKVDRKKGVVRSSIPVALSNLAAAADLDLSNLHSAQQFDDRGKVRTILERAEESITQMLRESWTQSKLSLSLELDGWRLQILLKSEKGDYVKVVERSDGLRQFLALLMFLSRQPKNAVKPIVLIDEAESHLHYDAQADLVQRLATQSLAAKVMYTTHSAGCLPEDLGAGVRMVSANEPHSIVENWFWDTQRPGFSPLLFAMGANTLAFVPTRYALIAEGAADMILVPAILKEGLQRESLGFQVVPGLSSGSATEIAIIDNESARTAYLCDGDDAGLKMKVKVRQAGVKVDKILTLPAIDGDDTVIEDYVLIDSYIRAANEEIKRSGCADEVTASDLPRPNRPKQLEKWCEEKGVQVPSKRAVAYHIVEDKYDHPIVDPNVVEQVETLFELITTALELQET